MAQEIAPGVVIQQAVGGFGTSRALYVALKLGVPDLLTEGPLSSGEIAERAGADASSVFRLLRYLSSFGFFAQSGDSFALTPVSQLLRSDVPQSQRGSAMVMAGMIYEAFEDLEHAVRTGTSAYAHHFGQLHWQRAAEDPALQAEMQEGYLSFQAQALHAIRGRYAFTGIHTLVDLGGAMGGLLAGILREHPKMRGILFDTPSGVAGHERVLDGPELADRVQVVTGDFFEAVPEGGDAYLLSRILRDWSDAEALTILRSVRKVIPPDGRLLLIDPVVPAGDAPQPPPGGDLVLRVLFDGGRDRTEEEFRSLLTEAGFSLQQVVNTGWLFWLLEATPA